LAFADEKKGGQAMRREKVIKERPSHEDFKRVSLANRIISSIVYNTYKTRGVTKEDFNHLPEEQQIRFINPMFDGEELNLKEALRTIASLLGFGTHDRVIMACMILVENCCDPNVDYLEWKPELKAFVEKLEKDVQP
jgi:hypothetical protein